jgi:hypothetical protein
MIDQRVNLLFRRVINRSSGGLIPPFFPPTATDITRATPHDDASFKPREPSHGDPQRI